MSEIADILSKLEGTSEYQVLTEIEKSYDRIDKEQESWYKISGFLCPAGCGLLCLFGGFIGRSLL